MTENKRNMKWVKPTLIIVAAIAALVIVWFAVGRDCVDTFRARGNREKSQALYYTQTPAAEEALPADELPQATEPVATPQPAATDAPLNETPPQANADAAPAQAVQPSEQSAPAAQTLAADAAAQSLTVAAPRAAAEPEDPYRLKDAFQTLHDQNPDVVGWLTVGDTVDEPVVQRDNEHYIKYNFFGEQDRNGTLFLNESNHLLPRDDVLLIHGHNMRSGDMFGKLLDYRKQEYMKQHPLTYFTLAYTTGDEQDCYVPVAAFDASMLTYHKTYFDITQIVFESQNASGEPRQSPSFQAYLDAIQKRSYWPSPVDVTVEDKLLMLITCSYEQEDGRFVLVLRQLRDGETPEEMAQMIGA